MSFKNFTTYKETVTDSTLMKTHTQIHKLKIEVTIDSRSKYFVKKFISTFQHQPVFWSLQFC